MILIPDEDIGLNPATRYIAMTTMCLGLRHMTEWFGSDHRIRLLENKKIIP